MSLHCYIDEAGDEGIETGGSRWFILGALVVPDVLDLQTGTAVSRIKKRFGKNDQWPLHWSQLKLHDRKRYVCQELLTEDWMFACVATDKTHPHVVQAAGLRGKYALYFYSARLLLERLSWYARDNGNERAIPIFEHRSNLSYEGMGEYFDKLTNWQPPTEMSWRNVEYRDFEIRAKTKRRLLQAADCVCGALREGLEYSGYGLVEPSYILSMGERFYRRRGNLFSYGLKFQHADTGTLNELKREYEWLKTV